MKARRGGLRLGTQLILSSLILQGIMLALLLVSSLRLIEDELQQQAQQHLVTAAPQLSAALAAPLAQHDYATAQEILDAIVSPRGYRRLVLYDMRGRQVAAAGVDGRAEAEGAASDDVREGRLDVTLGKFSYGSLHYRLATDYISKARQRVLEAGIRVAFIALVATLLILGLVGYWLTRRLAHLTEASRALAEGRFDVPLPEGQGDEVGQLAAAFREMAGQLQSRLQQLRQREQQLFAISHHAYDLELWIDPAGRLVWVNPSVERMTGFSPEECLAMEGFPLCLIHPDDLPQAEPRLREGLQGSFGEGFQFRLRRRNGSYFWAAANWQPIHDQEQRFLGLRASIRDISDLKTVEREMLDSMRLLEASEAAARQYLSEAKQERARLRALLSAMNLGILFVGDRGQVVYVNPAFRHIWGMPEAMSPVGMDVTAALAHAGTALARPEEFARHIETMLKTRDAMGEFEIALRDGRFLTQVNYPVTDKDGVFIGQLWVYADVTRERQTAEQLLYLAERDSLTGLYNRHRFQEQLNRVTEEAQRSLTSVALLFFDLDEFKAINDHFGHRAGDAILIRVASEVSGVVRRHEGLFRLGGDEFAIIMPSSTADHASALADRVVRAISQITLRFEGHSLRISSSLGIALYPDHAQDTEQLVAFADAAMYQAKQAGKNAWRIYRADLDRTPEMLSRLTWNERLAEAIAHDRFELHFQGVYTASDRRLSHLEVLLRLRDAESGELIPPGEFIPVAEKSQKIVEVDRWALGRVIRLLAASPAMPPVAVNLSGRSFDTPGMPAHIADLLRQAGVAPGRLLIEITETAAVSDLSDAQRFIDAIRQTGCRVCLDDFGAGFASFAYLKHLEVDAIKIDGMFIRNLAQDHDNQVFVRGMVEVARGLGKETIAECVEDEMALGLLVSIGVDKVQGYFLDMPQAEHPALG